MTEKTYEVTTAFRWTDPEQRVHSFEKGERALPPRAAEIALMEGWAKDAKPAGETKGNRRRSKNKAKPGAPENKDAGGPVLDLGDGAGAPLPDDADQDVVV